MSAVATRRRKFNSWQLRQVTPELVEELASYFSKGATVKIAAGKIGIPPGRLRMWLAEGEREIDSIYEDKTGEPTELGSLYDECVKAVAGYLLERVDTLTEADAGWQAAGWILERRDEDFNPAAKVEVSGPQGGPIEHEGRTISALVDVIAFAQGIGAGHFLGLDAGDPERALPAAETLLPDPPAPERPAEPSADVPGT
jgi:hypothetical protein